MRRLVALVAILVLVGCSGAPLPPTVDAPATATRVNELAILATAAAPTATPTLTPTLPPTNTPVPTATATNTPVPPTPTATQTRISLPTAKPTAAAKSYHDLPIPPSALLTQTVSEGNVIFSVAEGELAVSAFMKREWQALGLVFLTTQLNSGITFYVYSYPSNYLHLVTYGVSGIDSGHSLLSVIDQQP